MKKKIRIELSLEELNEVYYVFAKTYLDKPYKLAKYNVVEKVMDYVREELEKEIGEGNSEIIIPKK